MDQINQENFLRDLLDEIASFRSCIGGQPEIDGALKKVKEFLKKEYEDSIYICDSLVENGHRYNLELCIEKKEFRENIVIPSISHICFQPAYYFVNKIVFKECYFKRNVDNGLQDPGMVDYKDCRFFGKHTIRDSNLQGNISERSSHLSIRLTTQGTHIEGLDVKQLTLLPDDKLPSYFLRLRNNKICEVLDLVRFQEFSGFVMVGNSIGAIQFSTSNFKQLLPSSTIFLKNRIKEAFYGTPASRENLYFLYGNWKDLMLQKHNTENARIFHAEQLRVKENKTLGDRVLLFCMKHLNDFGQSWVKPVVIFLLLNLAFLGIVYWLVWSTPSISVSSFSLDFLNLLNPTSITKLPENVISIFNENNIDGGIKKLLVNALYLLRSVFSAILIYLIIKSAKKFQF